jgi:hypothetical protein
LNYFFTAGGLTDAAEVFVVKFNTCRISLLELGYALPGYDKVTKHAFTP